MSERILESIRRRHKEDTGFGAVGGDRRQFDIDFLLRYIDTMKIKHSEALIKALREGRISYKEDS